MSKQVMRPSRCESCAWGPQAPTQSAALGTPNQVPPPEPTDEQIMAVIRGGYRCDYNSDCDHIEFARAILALRNNHS